MINRDYIERLKRKSAFEANNQGYNDAVRRKSIKANPYDSTWHPVEYIEYQKGWFAAKPRIEKPQLNVAG